MENLSKTAKVKKIILQYMEDEKPHTNKELKQAILKEDSGLLNSPYMMSTVLYQMTKKEKTLIRCGQELYQRAPKRDEAMGGQPEGRGGAKKSGMTAVAREKFEKALKLMNEMEEEFSVVPSLCTVEEYEACQKLYRKSRQMGNEIEKLLKG